MPKAKIAAERDAKLANDKKEKTKSSQVKLIQKDSKVGSK